MPTPTLPISFIIIPIILTMILLIVVIIKPSIIKKPWGKIFGFHTLFILPILVGLGGGLLQSEHATSTEYCLSCHIMDSWGKSIHVDDKEFVAAYHYQNYFVPRDRACYVCHSDYVWYGGITAKIRGLKHVYVQYIGKMPEPKDIELYEPYHNRECLSCHGGARKHRESRHHNKDADMLTRIDTNALSCMESKCHEVVHNIDELADMEPGDFWKETGKK